MSGFGGNEKKKALAVALRENLKRRKARERGRKAEAEAAELASQAGAPPDATPVSGDSPKLRKP